MFHIGLIRCSFSAKRPPLLLGVLHF